MKKFLTVLLPSLILLTACDAEYGDTDERMFETDYDDGDDDDDDLDVLPNDVEEEPGWDLEKSAMGDEGLDLDAPEAPTPDLDVLDAPYGDPIQPQIDDGEDDETELSPLPEKEWSDGSNTHAGDHDSEASDEYDEGVIPEPPEVAHETAGSVESEAGTCEGAGGNAYQTGDLWEEDCNVCACTEQGVQCTQMECGVTDEYDTADVCDGRDLGDKWLHEDGCNICACTEAGIACTVMVCDMEVN
jgi:hypothetical protein